jgi:CubicO group peptidase (beta-lactamase class C family)
LHTPDALLAAELDRLLRRAQADGRLPSVSAAVLRAGEVVWSDALGASDVEGPVPATVDTQYRVGSITKTFTAVAVMQLRDAGALDLEDTLDRHLPGVPHRPTLRSLLAHVSGLQREPPGDIWETLRFASVDELVAELPAAERVLPAGSYWHYSNLAFALLGVVVERVSGSPYAEYLQERILDPLGLARTALQPVQPAARGYLVQPYSDGVIPESPVDTAAFSPAGQLWSTVGDLCRWGAFLAGGDGAVLAVETLAEMRALQSLSDLERWTGGYGLGLGLRRDGERILVGHGGAMPGFIAALYVSPRDQVGAAVLTNSGTARVEELALKLIATTVERAAVPPEPWRVEAPAPGELETVLGRWWTEGSEVVFSWKRGRLEARMPDAPKWAAPAVFEREDDDRYRTVSGPERGEWLRLVRDPDGRVVRMYWATYPLTREPRTFGRA